MDLNARLTELEARLTRVERGARRWKAAAMVLGGLLGVGALAAAGQNVPVADVLRTQSLEIVSGTGDVVVSLGSDQYGGSARVFSRDGNRVIGLQTLSGGGQLTVAAGDGGDRVVLGSDEYGGVVGVHDASDRKVAGVEVATRGGLVSVSDSEGTPMAAMDVATHGGRMVVNGPGEHAAVVLARDQRGTGIVFINNERGGQVFVAGANDAGDGMVNTYNDDGKPVITLGSTGRDALLSVFDRRGNEAVQVGVFSSEGRVIVRDRQGNTETFRP